MPHSTHGTIVLMGSGEMAPRMVEVHKYAMSLVEGSVKAAFIDTPAGFQLNADLLAEKAQEYFQQHLSTDLAHVAFKHAGRASRVELQAAVSALHNASYIFAGPGSPSYAVKNWRGTPVFDAMFETITHGGCLTFASAAALTVGRYVIPVYEVYKVGSDAHWIDGLDILGHNGLNVAVVPHWNNNSGGDHDTNYCFMGAPRWQRLREMLPAEVVVLGIDEHTACILRIDDNIAEVRGVGQVTVLSGDIKHVFGSGDSFSLDLLRSVGRSAGSPASPLGDDTPTWEALRAKHDSILEKKHPTLTAVTDYTYDVLKLLTAAREAGDWPTMRQAEDALRSIVVDTLATLDHPPVDEDAIVKPYVDLLLTIREELRDEKQWGHADTIRDRLTELGIEVQDTPDGVAWARMGN